MTISDGYRQESENGQQHLNSAGRRFCWQLGKKTRAQGQGQAGARGGASLGVRCSGDRRGRPRSGHELGLGYGLTQGYAVGQGQGWSASQG